MEGAEKEGKRKQAAIWRGILSSHISKLLPTKKYFLAVTEFLGKPNHAQKLQIHLKFCAKCDYQVHAELDDEVQTGEKGMHEE